MRLVIATVEKNLFTGQAYSATLPTVEGELTVMEGHMPLVVPLRSGTIRVRRERDSEYEEFPSADGVLEVTSGGAVVLL